MSIQAVPVEDPGPLTPAARRSLILFVGLLLLVYAIAAMVGRGK